MANETGAAKAVKSVVEAYGMEKVVAILGDLAPVKNSTVQLNIDTEALKGVFSYAGLTFSNLIAEVKQLDPFKKAAKKELPAEFLPVIAPAQLDDTMLKLDAATEDIIQRAADREAVYGEKGPLLKRQKQLEGQIKVVEATALMMDVKGSGKDAYAMVGDDRVNLGTETMKDAFRRMTTKAQREELAEILGEIEKINADQQKASDASYAAKDACETIRAKANLQAALLYYLAGR